MDIVPTQERQKLIYELIHRKLVEYFQNIPENPSNRSTIKTFESKTYAEVVHKSERPRSDFVLGFGIIRDSNRPLGSYIARSKLLMCHDWALVNFFDESSVVIVLKMDENSNNFPCLHFPSDFPKPNHFNYQWWSHRNTKIYLEKVREILGNEINVFVV